MTDYTTLITSEHNTLPQFMAMVGTITDTLSDIAAVIASIPSLFDLDVAAGAQQDIVGLWIGQPRAVTAVLLPDFFGFSDDVAAQPFGELTDPTVGGRFYELGEDYTVTSVLSDSDYSVILQAKILCNQAHGFASEFMAALQLVVPDVTSPLVTDPGTLALDITLPIAEVTLTQVSLLTNFDILPRPAGVSLNFIYI